MNIKKRIIKELKIQQSIEGFTPDTGLLLKIVPLLTSQSELLVMVDIGEHRYGKLSYECHRFYYPSKLLRSLEQFFTDKKESR